MSALDSYWKPSKLDFLYECAGVIDDPIKLQKVISQMSDRQIRATFNQFEDPYSDFNIGEEYSSYYWERFKTAALKERPSLLLF